MNRIFCVIAILLGASPAASAEETETILWLGSSSTFYHDMPREATHWMTAHGGKQFTHHWIGEGGTWTYEYVKPGFRPKQGLPEEDESVLGHIRRVKYDFVILQVAVGRWEEWQEAIPHFIEATQEAGSQLLLYEQGWDQKPGSDALSGSPIVELAYAENMVLVPCRTAWQRVRQERPDLELHDEVQHDGKTVLDRTHPGLLGNYVNQCLFFMAVTEKSPEVLPAEIHHPRRAEDDSKIVPIDPQIAKYLQQTAAQVWEEVQEQAERTGQRD